MAARCSRTEIEVKIVIHVAEPELNIPVKPAALKSLPTHRLERRAYIERRNRVGNGYSHVAACSAELWFICNQNVNLIGVELNCSFLMVPRRATKRIQFRFRHLSFRRRCLPDLDLDWLG